MKFYKNNFKTQFCQWESFTGKPIWVILNPILPIGTFFKKTYLNNFETRFCHLACLRRNCFKLFQNLVLPINTCYEESWKCIFMWFWTRFLRWDLHGSFDALDTTRFIAVILDCHGINRLSIARPSVKDRKPTQCVS